MSPSTPKTNDQMDKSFLSASIPELLKQMTREEKISLLAGKNFWETVPVPRLNIPSIKVTDGPNGARGGSFYKMTPASCLPNATCIGATFSTSAVEEAGKLLADEAKARNAVCLLAPTINIQRSPLGGRAFESFSEDPTLSGHLAAAYVNGLQSQNISATIKHFVGNDQEHERMGSDSVIPERALREIYLRPFQIAQARARPWAYMTAYNKVNGKHVSENKIFLQDILRKEWGHEGLVMSDWFGTYSVSDSINAGLDLEMPGPTIWRANGLVEHSITAHKVDPRQIDKLAGNILTWAQKLAKANSDIVYAKPGPEKTRTSSQKADAKILRRLGTEGIVLLKNDSNILPVTAETKKVAVIGPNAKAKVFTGGGSASLRCAWSQTPWEGLEANKPKGVELSYALGASTSKFLPLIDEPFTTVDGKPGFNLRHYNIDSAGKQESKPLVDEVYDISDLFMGDFSHPGLGKQYCTEIEALLTSPIDGEWEVGMCVTGQGWVYVNDKQLMEDTKDQVRGSAFFGCGTVEKKASFPVKKGEKYRVRFLHDSRAPASADGTAVATPFNNVGLRVGHRAVAHPDHLIKEAAAVAVQSDVAIIVAGLNADWESEGYDRPDLSLPGRTNDLIAAVAAANPNTVVILQGGSALSMPWVNDVKGVVYAWYLGNECGNAIADIVYGNVNPSGRLPLSLPKREQDVAAMTNFKSARTKVNYEEGIWVGYKHHNARGIEPLYAFGHGLSYTTFEYSDLKVTSAPKDGLKANDWKVEVSVKVKNTGKVSGSHSVHFYVCPPDETATSLKHPQWTLQAFDKVYDLKAGSETTVKVTLDKYAVSHWDEVWQTWRAEQGEWTVCVGKDASIMEGQVKFTINHDLEWTGL
ncbi:glycoside hydrolase superfamily [Kockovaella imperatae]|uniref:beta-glucosidase n=1 Tax=Kockovaella imperatae TaxID=4999 RepID=A0A1Y1UB89_9TREE|nr:glycoside hydrolase superfamily [Kockovaella imperatae]ORX35301.1 glycoside hydrolase superfamily [Kockovaella imperatae]